MYVTFDLREAEGKIIYLVSLTSGTCSFVLGYICFLELFLELGIPVMQMSHIFKIQAASFKTRMKPLWEHLPLSSFFLSQMTSLGCLLIG